MFIVDDIPTAQYERVICSIEASIQYEIPANIMLAVAEQEAGSVLRARRNSNSTYDVGQMQFNTAYLQDLQKYGISASDVAAGGCYSFRLAAWRIRGHLVNDDGGLWSKVSNYHSKTEQYNRAYRAKIKVKSDRWAEWLKSNSFYLKEGDKGAFYIYKEKDIKQINNLAAKIDEHYKELYK